MRNSEPFIHTTPSPAIEQLLGKFSHRLDVLSQRHGLRALRISIGVVFLWFGVLKFFPSVSPAEKIAVQTLTAMTAGLISPKLLLFGLATFETTLGACFVAGVFRRPALSLLVAHMLGTGVPFLLFPSQLFNHSLLVPTFLGQYIMKNIIIVSAALVLQRRWH